MIHPCLRLAARPCFPSRLLRAHIFIRPHTSQPPLQSPASGTSAATTLAAAAATPPPLPNSVLTRLTSPLKRALYAYGSSQRHHPWLTQIATSCLINLLGDANAQFMFSEHDYDIPRTLRMVFTGALFAIPGNEWYTRISYAFSSYSKPVAVALRVGLSQLIFSPVFLVLFFMVQGVLVGMSEEEIWEKVKGTMPGAWADSLKLWPAVGVVNFWYVPLEFRALLGGVASLGWNTWLSYLNAREAKEGKAVEEVVEVVEVPLVPVPAVAAGPVVVGTAA